MKARGKLALLASCGRPGGKLSSVPIPGARWRGPRLTAGSRGRAPGSRRSRPAHVEGPGGSSRGRRRSEGAEGGARPSDRKARAMATSRWMCPRPMGLDSQSPRRWRVRRVRGRSRIDGMVGTPTGGSSTKSRINRLTLTAWRP
jgi:hypothetical protein